MKFPLIQKTEVHSFNVIDGEKAIQLLKRTLDLLLPRFGFGDVDQAAIVNDRFGKRALRVIAVGYAVYDEPPRKLHQRL